MKIFCLYHADCPDGLMSACIVRRHYGDSATYLPVHYNEPIPDLPALAHVIIVDFSYETEDMKKLIRRAGVAGVTLLDHHPRTETIKAEIDHWLNADPEGMVYRGYSSLYYDGGMSGALLAWQWLASHTDGAPAPMLVHHVSDRDLWQFRFPDTKAVMAGLMSYPMDLDTWGQLLAQPDAVAQCLQAAPTALRISAIRIQWAISNTLRMITPTEDNTLLPAGLTAAVPLINCSHDLVSETCGHLAKTYGIAMAYWDTPAGRKFSVRSSEVNIRRFCAFYVGGEGHDRAGGFTVPRTHPLAQL